VHGKSALGGNTLPGAVKKKWSVVSNSGQQEKSCGLQFLSYRPLTIGHFFGLGLFCVSGALCWVLKPVNQKSYKLIGRTTPDRARRNATLCGVCAIGLWASLAVLTTVGAGIPPFQLLALTFGLAGTLGCLWQLRPGGGGVAALRQPPAAAALAIGGLFGYHALYFIAFSRAPAVEVNLVNYLWPLLIVLFSALLPGVRIYPRQWLAALLGLAGATLVITRGQWFAIEARHAAGYLAALGAALTWGAYSVLNRRFGNAASSAIAGSCLAVALLGAVVHLATEVWTMPTPGQWAGIVAMALGPLGAAFWFWDRGTKHGDIVLLGIASYAAPFLSTLLLLAAGRARAHWTQGAALVLLLAGALLSMQEKKV
jgi:drug/metabolite transporter (DMT)-like permease